MTKILVECPSLIASVRVGVLQPLEPLAEHGKCEIRYRNTMDITRQDIAWCDVMVTVRGSEYPTLRAVQAAKEAGKFLIYFLDDDLLGIPGGYASSVFYSDPQIRQNIVQILEMCDVLWAVNQRILEKYGKWCPRTVLSKVPASLQKEIKNNDKLHVLYAGSFDHNGMIQEKIAPAVRRILEEYPDKADFTFIGADPKLSGLKGVKYYSYFDSYDDYQRVLMEGCFDLGLAPGFRTSFFACKYFNKFIEYATRGIVGIYENCAPFTDIVQDGVNGILCEGSAEDWYAALRAVITGKHDLVQLGSNAQNLLLKEFAPEEIAQRLSADIPELVEYAAPPVRSGEIRIPPMKWIFIDERLRLHWRTYGILALLVIPMKAIRKVWRVLRQKVSV